MLTRLRKKFSKILDDLALILARLHLKPNHVTVLSLLFSSLAFTSLYVYKNILLYVLFLILSGFCDVLDGALARYLNLVTKFGAFLDSTIDRINDALVIYGLKYIGFNEDLIVAIIISSILISYVRARGEALGLKMEGVGIIERAERLLFIILASILAIYDLMSAYFVLLLLLILSIVTIIQRIIHVYMMLSSKN